MYYSNDFIMIPLYERSVQEGFKNLPPIQSCKFSTDIEESNSFRIKLLKIAGIPMLTEEVKDYIDITTELWFNGEEVKHVNYIMFDRHLMEGAKGPIVSSMGSVVWNGDSKSKLFELGIGKLIPFLKKVKYIGPISLTTLLTKDNLYAQAITPTFLYNSIFVLLEMYKGKVGKLLTDIANNKLEIGKFKSNIGIGVDLSVLPFPLQVPIDMITIIEGLNRYNLKHFWGYDITSIRGKYQTMERGGRIGTFTARGDEVKGFSALRDAKRRVYRTINNIKIDGLMYRRDIGESVESNKLKLVQNGWL